MRVRSKESTVTEEATRWLIELEDEPSPAAMADFASWLKASPRHIEEFLTSAAAWSRFDGLDRERKIDVQHFQATASANVVHHFVARTAECNFGAPALRRWRWAACIAAMAMLAALGWLGTQLLHAPVYATSVGEHRSIKLSDGSLIQLNTATRVQAHLDEQVREVQLIEGEALFTVARDTARPFRVRSGEWVIQALGTEFNVNRRGRGANVSVIEGTVKILGASAESTLGAGEEANIDVNGQIDKRRAADIAKAVAWRERRLVFKDDTLARIVDEFNRYNASYQIRLVGDAGKELRLTGVFKADDPQAIVLYLQQNSELIVRKNAAGSGEVTIEERLLP
jgi:transmembrane sensor